MSKSLFRAVAVIVLVCLFGCGPRLSRVAVGGNLIVASRSELHELPRKGEFRENGVSVSYTVSEASGTPPPKDYRQSLNIGFSFEAKKSQLDSTAAAVEAALLKKLGIEGKVISRSFPKINN